MTQAVDGDLTEDQSRQVTSRVREELARRRISRQRLADDARISLSTLEKALAGQRPFTLATLVRLEAALDVSLRVQAAAAGQAPDDLGAYSRAATAWLEGDYLTLRPSFEVADAIYAYRTRIGWDETQSCLVFQESERLDSAFTQSGRVSLPNQSGHVYLITNDHGQVRLTTLGRATIAGEMHGLLSTLQSGRGGHLTPVAAPIVLAPIRDSAQVQFGRLAPDDEAYAASHAILNRTLDEGFARLIP